MPARDEAQQTRCHAGGNGRVVQPSYYWLHACLLEMRHNKHGAMQVVMGEWFSLELYYWLHACLLKMRHDSVYRCLAGSNGRVVQPSYWLHTKVAVRDEVQQTVVRDEAQQTVVRDGAQQTVDRCCACEN